MLGALVSLKTPTVVGILLLGTTLIGCRLSPREPVTLRYTYSFNEDRPSIKAIFQKFTQETGIRVENIPVPQYTREYVDLASKLLKDGSGADVLNSA
jgi:ABC-type glycerol-3-phosphate transport system substrate-binding protein